MKKANVPISPTKYAPTTQIKRILPQVECSLKNCEITVNIGLFFDGTNNNKDRDSPTHSDSNISRLFDQYPDIKQKGYKRIYIPGAGTRFPEIGEFGESKASAGCAFGCEGRVIYALLTVFNFLQQVCFNSDMFDKGSTLALCRNSSAVPDDLDSKNLTKLGISHGLLQPELGTNKNRRDFLTQQARNLETKLKEAKPRIRECFVDVFGFSRGAAEARVFCHWLDELLVEGRFAGVSLHYRFVGIIDTVASAGFWSGAAALVGNSTGGHGAWASAESLRLPTTVKNCVHMVAMHELRRNFPLDEIGIDGEVQTGWVQHAYPGAHSDVGGGYAPGELGIAVGDDSMKLSQIPLNHMLECAIAAGAPLERPAPLPGLYNPFAIHPNLAKAYDNFISAATLAPRPLYLWLQLYLNWRWQVRNHFHTTSQVKQANKADRDILLTFNNSLIEDAAALERTAKMGLGRRAFAIVTDAFYRGARRDFLKTSVMEPEAREVLALAQRAQPTPPAFASLFDGYVHDSLAGFNSPTLELPGYWRYRRVFLGADEHVIAANQDSETTRSIA